LLASWYVNQLGAGFPVPLAVIPIHFIAPVCITGTPDIGRMIKQDDSQIPVTGSTLAET